MDVAPENALLVRVETSALSGLYISNTWYPCTTVNKQTLETGLRRGNDLQIAKFQLADLNRSARYSGPPGEHYLLYYFERVLPPRGNKCSARVTGGS